AAYPCSRRDELPEAPQSFLAHFTVLPDERMERAAHPARRPRPQYSTSICLRITFSGSTSWRHLDDGATGPDGTQRSSTQTSRPVRHLCGCRGFLRSRPQHHTRVVCLLQRSALPG